MLELAAAPRPRRRALAGVLLALATVGAVLPGTLVEFAAVLGWGGLAASTWEAARSAKLAEVAAPPLEPCYELLRARVLPQHVVWTRRQRRIFAADPHCEAALGPEGAERDFSPVLQLPEHVFHPGTGDADEFAWDLLREREQLGGGAGGARGARQVLTCAVVGTSRSILSSSHGAAIDGHDVVVRFNQARQRGFERHVGSRTDLRVLDDARALDGSGGVELLPTDRNWTAERVLVRLHSVSDAPPLRSIPERDGDRVWVASPELEHAAVRLLWGDAARESHGPPTAGLVAVVLTLSACDRTSLYGFDMATRQRTGRGWVPDLLSDSSSARHRQQSDRYFDEPGRLLPSPRELKREEDLVTELAEVFPRRIKLVLP